MKWISIKERLPEIKYNNKKAHIEVLGWDGKRIWHLTFRYLCKYDENGKMLKAPMFHTYCSLCDDASIKMDITHWMPLPELPLSK